jgi:hypothetical protein
MAETMAVPRVAAQQPAGAAPASAPAVAQPTPVREQWYRNLQVILFTAGALCMPAGLFAIFLGWYGVAHTKYQYDQLPYVVSGGVLGLALVFIGGFLYFGAWLQRIGNEQRESATKLAESVLALVDIVAKQNGVGIASASGASEIAVDDSLVLAGNGRTIHRRDCALIAHRADLRPVNGETDNLGTCRVCRPTLENV